MVGGETLDFFMQMEEERLREKLQVADGCKLPEKGGI